MLLSNTEPKNDVHDKFLIKGRTPCKLTGCGNYFSPTTPPPQPGLTISRKFSLTINTVQLHSFRLLVKTSCLLAENLNGTPVHDVNRHVLFGRGSALIWYHIDVIVISLLLYGQLSCHP